MDPITSSAISKVTTEVVDVAKKSKEPRKTFDDLWYLTFGKLGLKADKLRAKHQADLENYKTSIIEKIDSIPVENLQEPKMSIVGPALDAARFYIEEEELRDMFAKVISSSFDKTKSPHTHHSFVEIIKQITPIEAKILTLFIDNPRLPIVRYEITNSETESVIDSGYPFFKGFLDDIVTGQEYMIELSNLKRLNLIQENNYQLKNNEKYEFYEQTTFHKTMLKHFNTGENKCSMIKGVIELSPLGESFVQICI